MGKMPKISYKFEENTQLKPTAYHSKVRQPLYVRVLYQKQSTFLPSVFLSLYANRKFGIVDGSKVSGPSMKFIIQQETALIEYIINEHRANFSLELFKEQYRFLGTDLLTAMEAKFRDFLYVYFTDEGLPDFAVAMSGELNYSLRRLIDDLKSIAKPVLFEKFMKSAASYAPPFLPLYAYAASHILPYPVTLTVLEWMKVDQAAFKKYIDKNFPFYQYEDIVQKVQNLVTEISNGIKRLKSSR